ncbi:MAG: hypothetical protein FWF96_06900, partial [Kiritimatiellaeota bacterium]|nr:hypothetical protein [Kiritimatiellota bacterium]
RGAWGFEWERLDDTMGQPKKPAFETWDEFERLPSPDPCDPARFENIRAAREKFKDKYLAASLGLSGFSLMACMRGFAGLLEDFYAAPAQVEKLADRVFGFEERVIARLGGRGVDAVQFSDDWGTQNDLVISPGLWRSFFKPRYKRQFDLAHSLGLDVYFHCCGQIAKIIPDFVELGVDILNISQPNLFDIEKLGAEFGGKTCFMCPVSYQTTSLSGTREEIFAAVRRMVESLGRFNGGFIGYMEEYHSIGLSDANYRHCEDAYNAFATLGLEKGGK